MKKDLRDPGPSSIEGSCIAIVLTVLRLKTIQQSNYDPLALFFHPFRSAAVLDSRRSLEPIPSQGSSCLKINRSSAGTATIL